MQFALPVDVFLGWKKWCEACFHTYKEHMIWLMRAYNEGRIIVLDEGNFLASMKKWVDDRSEDVATEAAEKAVLRILYDHGLVNAKDLK